MRIFAYLLMLAVIGAGATLFFIGISDAFEALEVRRWQSVEVEVVESSVIVTGSENRRYHFPRVRYRFVLQGKEYFGNRMTLADQPTSMPLRAARAYIARYPVGSKHVGWVSPEDPSRSVIDPSPRWLARALGLFASLMMIAPGVWGIRRLRRMSPT